MAGGFSEAAPGAWLFMGMVLLHTATTLVCTANVTAEGALYTQVFTNYNSDVRPIGDHGHSVSVQLHIALHQVTELDAEAQSLQNLVVITSEWTDDNLQWDPAQHSGIEFMIIPASRLWLPDFGIANSAAKFYDSDTDDFRIQLKHTGHVTWSFGGHVTTKCDIQVETFPFDQQRCEFSLTNWMYDVNAVNLTLKEDEMDMDEYMSNVEWDVITTSCEYRKVTHTDRDGRTYPTVTCSLLLARHPTYYLINLFIPSYFILALFLGAFWLPPGHRAIVPLQMTTLLIFSVMLLNISGHLPRTSKIPHITMFALVVIAISTVSVLLTVAISVMRIYMQTSARVPRSIRNIAFNYLAPPLCLKTLASDVMNKDSPDVTTTDVMKLTPAQEESVLGEEKGVRTDEVRLLQRIADFSEESVQHLSQLTRVGQTNPRSAVISAEWDLLSKVSARLAFWVIVIVILGLTIEFVLAETSKSRL